MKLSCSSTGIISLEFGEILFKNLQPVINGVQENEWEVSGIHPGVASDCTSPLIFGFNNKMVPGLYFGMVFQCPEGSDHGTLKFWLEGFPEHFMLNSFGLHFTEISGFRSFLKNGYHSWDGSNYVPSSELYNREESKGISWVGYAMMQFLPQSGSGSSVLGFERHDRFQHTFTIKTKCQMNTLSIEVLWDQKKPDQGGFCQSENLFILEHSEVEEGLRAWARLIANSSRPLPRKFPVPVNGWCSWYNLYAAINQKNIIEHLKAAEKARDFHHLDLRIFQIDDGFTPEMGDWLEVKPQFPDGMAPVMDAIQTAGFIPGLWIAPFVVGNRSQLYLNHPDWVLQDRLKGGPLVQMHFYGEFRWHKRSEEYYILDVTNPDALAYLGKVFSVWYKEWGCKYFKTDFMFFGSEYGPDRAVYHTPGLTRIEVWRMAAEMIRDSIGEAILSGCGCPLWASIGLVDTIRVGRDMGVSWHGERSAISIINDQATRNFGNHILWQIDPDCILLRNRFHELSDSEIRSLAIYCGMTGGVVMTSDHLGELTSDRIQLLSLILSEKKTICSYPQLGQSCTDHEDQKDAVVVQVLRNFEEFSGRTAIHIFNLSDQAVNRVYKLVDLGLGLEKFLADWQTGQCFLELKDQINVVLKPHEGSLFFAADQPFQTIPQKLG